MARLKKETKKRNGRDRLNMRIPSELLDWAKKYVQAKNTTLTQHYIDFLTMEKAEEAAK